MRASIFRKAGDKDDYFNKGGRKGSCWAIALEINPTLYALNDLTKQNLPELVLWEQMHKPDGCTDDHYWLQEEPDVEYFEGDADELRRTLLLEAALNLEEQGYDDGEAESEETTDVDGTSICPAQ